MLLKIIIFFEICKVDRIELFLLFTKNKLIFSKNKLIFSKNKLIFSSRKSSKYVLKKKVVIACSNTSAKLGQQKEVKQMPSPLISFNTCRRIKDCNYARTTNETKKKNFF